ncbi:MAG: cytochrome c, partial [Rhizobiales bacterium]|nr:cytochrome c [Hyphomicrobiales bacterium]
DLVKQGQKLVSIGGCASCHQPRSGAGLSGGVRLETPFGAVISTNITPDPETGIGAWSQAAFIRAMREGVDRTGRYLYPVFPFDHYTLASDEDIAAIYAYLMSQPAVEAPPRENQLEFPFNIRWLMAGWNMLFLENGPYRADPARDEVWNRGAYLVEGLGHCAACHSPRNSFGARDRSRDYSGGLAEGWYGPALNDASPAPAPWDEAALINYLYDGWDESHGIAAGPMAEVITNIGVLSETDMAAVAQYLLSLQSGRAGEGEEGESAFEFAERVEFASANAPPPPEDGAERRGHDTYEERCANCHRDGSQSVPLALATAVASPDPRNLIHVILKGVSPSENAYFVRPMPGFAMLGDDEVADLVTFIRARFSRAPPWPDTRELVSELRASK